MKITKTLSIGAAACLLFAVGCNRSSSDRGAGQGTLSDRGEGVGSPSSQTPAAVDSSAASTNRSPVDAAHPADNTGRNVRDRSDAALTPGDQSESKADIDLSSRVRSAVTHDNQLSTTAKNIKIIVANGKVTLRGPVNTAAEKEQIAKIAQGVQGVTSVDDQLEVKANQ